MAAEGCARHTATGSAKAGLTQGVPANYATGFPNWSFPDEFLLLATAESEVTPSALSPLQSPLILAYVTGSVSYSLVKQTEFETYSVQELQKSGSSGGFFVLTALPDGRYRIFNMVNVKSLGFSSTSVTREVGKYTFADTTVTLHPAWSSEEIVGSGGREVYSRSLKDRSYQITTATMTEVAVFGATPKTNPGFVLRGDCPEFILASTCIGTPSAEFRLQQITPI